jgi:hypothetical protein
LLPAKVSRISAIGLELPDVPSTESESRRQPLGVGTHLIS